MNKAFQLQSDFKPTGDQPAAIHRLLEAFHSGQKEMILEGVTGSGKTFTMANLIAELNRPALVMSHNKTLAAQLYAELKAFFPNNAVEYFISYYDYYQPEAYIPQTDTFIEKDSSINEEIERLRLAATDALVNREDVIVVASVSCIYGLGSPEDYKDMFIPIKVGDQVDREIIMHKLVDVQYTRNDMEPAPGTFRVRGDILDIFPSYSRDGLRVEFFGNEVESLRHFDPVSGKTIAQLPYATISPARHFVMPRHKIEPAIKHIKAELNERVQEFEQQGRLLEAQRIRMRTEYDMEMLNELGYCSGIENYSRHLSGRPAGARPATLIDFFPDNYITIIDESHVTLPQVRGMFNGDRSRKTTLVEHGFRLPSALDNRPMNFDEFLSVTPNRIYVSATPGPYELEHGGDPVPQVIRPTGLVDPTYEIRPLADQIDDLMEELKRCSEKKERALVTTLTKRTAEDLSAYLRETGLRVQYLHSEIDALERVHVLRGLRKGDFDVLVGINLLREGLDLPEVALVAILDADKEGFLRSATSLIQTAGRAARHVDGRVLLYADKITDSMKAFMDTTDKRRAVQLAYNAEHGITPQGIEKAIQGELRYRQEAEEAETMAIRESGEDVDVATIIGELEREMMEAAKALEFERATVLRDQIYELKGEIRRTKVKPVAGRKLTYSTRHRKKQKWSP